MSEEKAKEDIVWRNTEKENIWENRLYPVEVQSFTFLFLTDLSEMLTVVQILTNYF